MKYIIVEARHLNSHDGKQLLELPGTWQQRIEWNLKCDCMSQNSVHFSFVGQLQHNGAQSCRESPLGATLSQIRLRISCFLKIEDGCTVRARSGRRHKTTDTRVKLVWSLKIGHQRLIDLDIDAKFKGSHFSKVPSKSGLCRTFFFAGNL